MSQKESGKSLLSKSAHTVTKADIVEKIHSKITHSKKEAHGFLELVFNELKDGLTKEGVLKISGFGNFTVNQKKSRKGRNPQTGEPMLIASRKTLTFQASQILKDRLNKNKG